jgi:AcrR family transcriptional regulator
LVRSRTVSSILDTLDEMVTRIVTSMSEPVKRHYASTLRAEQARAPRRAVVDAAGRLFVQHGYGATTVDAIAEAAGVSRKTVFTSVGGKVEALKLAVDWAIVGDDEPVPMLDRPEVARQRKEPDARLVLRSYAAMQRRSAARVAPLVHAAESAAGSDPAVQALVDEGKAQRRFGMGMLAGELGERGALPDNLTVDEAADVLWLFNDPLTYHRLVLQRGWSPERYEEWVASSLIALLVRPDYAVRS